MNLEHTELTVCRMPAPPRWVRTFAACSIFVLAIAQLSALANAAPVQTQEQSAAAHPQAKSEQERKDFNAAYALTRAANAEAAANDFAANYSTSELRRYLYSSAMVLYQRENNSAKMLAMGEKVLELDPENPLALVLTATALADGLTDRDIDREKKIGTIRRNATRAIQAAESGYSNTGGGKIYKTTLQAMAYSALGVMKLKTGDDAGAEKDLTAATSLAKIHPDPYIWYHLALAQDHRKKYAAALSSAEQALQLASADADLQKLVEVEHERLAGLVKSSRTADSAEPQ